MSIPKLIEISREVNIDPRNTVKIDGKEIKGITGVKIEYGLDQRQPIVTIKIVARRIKATVKSNDVKMIQEK